MSIAVENPTKDAIFSLLQDAALQAALGGRLYGKHPPEDPLRPYATFTIWKNNKGGMGLTRGPFRIELRTYAFSDLGSVSEAQSIDGQMQDLLTDATLTIDGFTHCDRIFYGDTPDPFLTEIKPGLVVHEVATNYTLWVEL